MACPCRGRVVNMRRAFHLAGNREAPGNPIHVTNLIKVTNVELANRNRAVAHRPERRDRIQLPSRHFPCSCGRDEAERSMKHGRPHLCSVFAFVSRDWGMEVPRLVGRRRAAISACRRVRRRTGWGRSRNVRPHTPVCYDVDCSHNGKGRPNDCRTKRVCPECWKRVGTSGT